MITPTGQITGVDGSPGYVYALQGGDNCTTVAEKLIAYADSRFQFQGRIGTRTEVIEPNMIDGILKSGGQVAANCSYNGVSVNIMFQSPTQVCLLPANGAQAIADEFVGAGIGGGYNDFDDPYADFNTAPAGGLAMSTPPDPRAGSRQPQGGGYPDFDDAMPPGAGNADTNQIVGIGEWILTFILLAIPIVNLVMLIVWLVRKKTKKSKKNFLLAELILFLIGALLSAGSFFLLGDQIIPILQNAGFSINGVTATNTTSNSSNASSNKNVIENISDNEYAANSNKSNKNNSNDLFSNANSNSSNANRSNLNESTSNTKTTAAVPALAVNINRVDFQVNGDDALAIFTVTGYNEGAEPVIPSDALRIQANQGITPLERATEATEQFAPASINEPIPANGNGTFQFAYHLAKDNQGQFNQQKVHVVVQNEYTLAQLAEGEY